MKYKTFIFLIIAGMILALGTSGAKGKKAPSASEAPAEPATGEQINWQALSAGGTMEGQSASDYLSGTVGGGLLTAASGDHSFAAGLRAKANHNGAFVWADATDADFGSSAANHLGSFVWVDATGVSVYSERNNQFRVRADGGARFDDRARWIDLRDDGSDLINTSVGARLTIGGVWTDASDRNLKENFAPVDRQEILDKIAALPITRWNYRSESDDVTHIGPMAQDFYAAFGVGEDDRHITTIDADGIALAAIQALYEKTKEIDALKAELAQLKVAKEAEISDIKTALSRLTARVESIPTQHEKAGIGSDELAKK